MGKQTKLSKRLKEARRLGGMTQAQFARAVGLKTHNINAYEQSRSNPKSDGLKKIAKYLKVAIEELL